MMRARRFLGYHFVRDESRNGVERAFHFGEFLRFGVVVEPAGVGHLPARFRVNHRAVEHHFAGFARLQLIDWAILCDDGLNPAILCARPGVKAQFGLERFRQLRVCRIRRLFRPALPGRPRAFLLLLHRFLEACHVHRSAKVSAGINNKVQRKTVCVV